MLGYQMKYSFSCLIYYVKPNRFSFVIHRRNKDLNLGVGGNGEVNPRNGSNCAMLSDKLS